MKQFAAALQRLDIARGQAAIILTLIDTIATWGSYTTFSAVGERGEKLAHNCEGDVKVSEINYYQMLASEALTGESEEGTEDAAWTIRDRSSRRARN